MPAALQLTATQDCRIEISGAVDAKGNPATLDGPVTYTSSDESKITVTPVPEGAATNMATIHAVGPVTPSGTNVVIAVDGDGKLGPEVFPIHDEIAVTVVAGDAVGFSVTAGEPYEQGNEPRPTPLKKK